VSVLETAGPLQTRLSDDMQGPHAVARLMHGKESQHGIMASRSLSHQPMQGM
jgi:hypothetical protein